MSFSLPVLAAVATLATLGQQSVTPSFSEMLAREWLESGWKAIADGYEAIYLSAASPGPAPEVRRMAAFRCGVCNQRLGVREDALLAFSTVVKGLKGPREAVVAGRDPLAIEAWVRLRRLIGKGGDVARGGGERPGAFPGLQPPEEPRDVGLDLVLDKASAEQDGLQKARRSAMESYRARAGRGTARAEAAERARSLLEGMGIALTRSPLDASVPLEGAGFAGILSSLEAPLGDEDRGRLEAWAADRFLTRAIAEAAQGPSEEASLALRAATLLAPSTWEQPLGDVRRFVAGAQRPTAAGHRPVREAALSLFRRIYFLREPLRLAEELQSVPEQGRDFRFVELLRRLQDALLWLPQDIALLAEARDQAEDARLRWLALQATGADQARWVSRLETAGDTVRELERLAEGVVSRELELRALESARLASAGATALEQVRAEVLRRLAVAGAPPRDARGEDAGRRAALALQALEEAAWMLLWAPQADHRGVLSAEVEALRGRLLEQGAPAPTGKPAPLSPPPPRG